MATYQRSRDSRGRSNNASFADEAGQCHPPCQKMRFSSQALDRTEELIQGPIPPPPPGLFTSLGSWLLMFARLLVGIYDRRNSLDLLIRATYELLRLLKRIPCFTGATFTDIASSIVAYRQHLLDFQLLLMGLSDRLVLQRIEGIRGLFLSSSFPLPSREFYWALFWGWHFISSTAPEFHQDFLEVWQRWL